MDWAAFTAACPEIAGLGDDRLRGRELCLLGTLRRDGSPRITPCEPDFAAGRLLIGMMWQSRKALDLLRDPRYVIHSCVANRAGDEGDFKLYGRAASVADPELRRIYCDTIRARIDWAPDEPNFHLFEFDVDAAGFVIFGDDPYGLAWNPGSGLRRWSIAN
jgi:hypothetical protein